jgi:DNA-binding NtrC family response regulator
MLNRDPSFVPPAILPLTLRRSADRRRGISALTTAVTTGLALTEPRAARERLEEELRCALQARSVRLRDDSAQAVAPPPDAVCFDVPASPGDGHARLEVIFDRPQPLDDWTCQLIEAATQLSSMVLELERAIGRGKFGSSLNRSIDGAAPLIGSSEAIRRVRERIERVAATDFTVFIEEGSGPEPHPIFIDVSCCATLGRGPREVEGAGEDGAELTV